MDKKKWIIGTVSGLVVLLLGVGLYFYLQYRKTDSFRLQQIGYTKEEAKLIIDKDIPLNKILEREKIPILTSMINYKYFLKTRIERYLSYYENNKDKSAEEIVRMVNANRDKNYYTDIMDIHGYDLDVITNRYYKLEEGYLPTDLVDISIQFAYAGQKMREIAYASYLAMAREAKAEGITLIVSTSFRTYEAQQAIYEGAVRRNGENIADTIAARAGHSEHQTGLALDISTYSGLENFEESDAYKWLKENCYRFGFIERYPKDAEELTGFSFEPWHYRYVGEEIAKKIQEEKITFDEYYTYYIEKR